jgi:predicted anti-sigma-YlaC factor YlaD
VAQRFPCGRTAYVRALLESRLSDVEQAALEAHLESCEVCRQACDELAAGSAFWSDVRRYAASEPTRQFEPSLGAAPDR